MLRKLLAAFAAAVLMTAVTGCETTQGAGEDIENLGESMEEGYEDLTD